MPLLDLSGSIDTVRHQGDLVYAVHHQGEQIYGARIDQLYGTGLGQVPLHLAVEDAVTSAGTVVSLPNRGGAGASLNAASVGSGITLQAGRLSITADSYLNLATVADANGLRLFLALSLSLETGLIALAGASESAADGERTNLRWDPAALRYIAQRSIGGVVGLVSSVAAPRLLGVGMIHMIEIEIAGQFKVWVDGVLLGVSPINAPVFRLRRLFAGHTAPGLSGLSGDIVAMRSDGSAAMDAPAAAIRNYLGAKLGVVIAA